MNYVYGILTGIRAVTGLIAVMAMVLLLILSAALLYAIDYVGIMTCKIRKWIRQNQ
jgi:hypothetical protein